MLLIPTEILRGPARWLAGLSESPTEIAAACPRGNAQSVGLSTPGSAE